MKLLQRNFTTPEQSKRLLKMGVPIDSADCMNFGNAHIFQIPFQRPFSEHLELHIQEGLKKMYTPCWSVGRLIEIMKICSDLDTVLGYQIAYNTKHKTSLLHIVIQIIEDDINEFDFSKLEEYENR